MKAQNFRGKYWSIFREKIRALKKIFRANFVLQKCHPNNLGGILRVNLAVRVPLQVQHYR